MTPAMLARLPDMDSLIQFVDKFRAHLDNSDMREAVLARAAEIDSGATEAALRAQLGLSETPSRSDSEGAGVPRLNSSDGILALDGPPPPRDFVIEGFLPAAKSATLAGPGGSSKTVFALHMVASVGTGRPFMGRSVQMGAAMALLGEEDREEAERRMGAIAVGQKMTDEEKALLRRNVRVFPTVGMDVRLTRQDNGALEGTAMCDEIIRAAKALEVESGLPTRLIVLDHAGLVHGGDFNAREDVVRTMVIINHITADTGAAVVLVAHSPKTTNSADGVSASDVAGSAAFVDLARSAYVVRTMDAAVGKKYGLSDDERKNYTVVTNVKANYTAAGEVINMMRVTVPGYAASYLHHVDLCETVKEFVSAGGKVRNAIVELLKERGGMTKESLLGYAAANRGRIPASKSRARAEVEAMLTDGSLVLRDPTPKERELLRIRGKSNGLIAVAC